MTTASAPGKAILFGEHAVVFGRPALAVPISDLRARASVEDSDQNEIRVVAPQTDEEFRLSEAGPEHPLRRAIDLTLDALEVDPQGLRISIDSEIPIAAGLGSGAAVTVALIRALAAHYGHELSRERQSSLAFDVEELHHGTPSGIDNTVIAFGRPVSFIRGAPPNLLEISETLQLVIGDTGRTSPTADAVAGVRMRRGENRSEYEELFDEIADITVRAKTALRQGKLSELGSLMNQNHACLKKLEVSTPELDELVDSARAAGALGAKLSGAGLGGVMLALVAEDQTATVSQALRDAGASATYPTEVRT